jgi:hypothetical protein
MSTSVADVIAFPLWVLLIIHMAVTAATIKAWMAVRDAVT